MERPLSDQITAYCTRRWPIREPQRNAHLFVLAAHLNDYGIDPHEAMSVCLRYADPGGSHPFTEEEIRRTVRSAYAKVEAHGSRTWYSAPRTAATTKRPTFSEEELRRASILAQQLRNQWRVDLTPTPRNTGNTATAVPSFDTDLHIPLVNYVRASPHLQKVIGAPQRGRADHTDRYLLGLVRDHLFMPSQRVTAEALVCFTGCSWDIAEQALQYIVQ